LNKTVLPIKMKKYKKNILGVLVISLLTLVIVVQFGSQSLGSGGVKYAGDGGESSGKSSPGVNKEEVSAESRSASPTETLLILIIIEGVVIVVLGGIIWVLWSRLNDGRPKSSAADNLTVRSRPSPSSASTSRAEIQIKFACPNCDQHIEVTHDRVGNSYVCPNCGEDGTIPPYPNA